MIDRLKELEASATPGPWRADLGNWDIEQIDPRNEICIFDPMSRDIHPENKRVHSYCDMEFIVEMRNALPKLLAFVQAYDDSRQKCGQLDFFWAMDKARKALDQES